MDNRWKALVVAALVAIATGAHAAQKYTCRDAGPCTCWEKLNPKAEIGYSTPPTVTITCVGGKSMSVKYWDNIPLSALQGTYAGYEPKP